MKLSKLSLTLLFFANCFLAFSQKDKDKEKFYYKDTIFEFAGFKVAINKSVATDKYFKANIVVTNTSDQFLIFNPKDIVGGEAGTSNMFVVEGKKDFVIAPKYTGRFTVKFLATSLRVPAIEMNFKSMKMTDRVEAVYEFSDFLIYSDKTKQIGPVTWTANEIKIDYDKDQEKKDFRMTGSLTYTGDKFLGIFYNNITITTNDGKTYINSGKTGNVLWSQPNKFYYDKTKPMEKMVFVFPVENKLVRPEHQPKLAFTNVLKEYSLVTIEGFKVKVVQGTLADYKGNPDNINSSGEKDIEEIE